MGGEHEREQGEISTLSSPRVRTRERGLHPGGGEMASCGHRSVRYHRKLTSKDK